MAATYPPPPFPGGYPPPSPYTFSSYLAPAPGFPPAPVYGFPTPPSAATYQQPFPFTPPAFPYATSYPCPPPAPAYAPASGFSPNWPIWPLPAPDPIPPIPTSTPSCCWSSSMTTPVAPHHPATTRQVLSSAAPPNWSSTCSPPPLQSHASSTWSDPSPASRVPQNGDLSSTAACTNRCSMGSSSSVSATDLPAPADSAAAANGPIPTETEVVLTKLRSANNVSSRSSPATTVATKLSTRSSSVGITGTSDVALNVLGEMPQGYGLHNLNRHSMFLADGTEHRFYALPENYPLERATPGPVFDACADEIDGCSTEIVDVFADLPEQHRHEEEQHESAQPTKCSKANNTTNLESMLVNNLQVPTTTQDASCVFKEMPVYDIYEDENSSLNCMDEQLVTPFHKALENASSEQLLKCFSKAPETEYNSACLNLISDVRDFTLELQQHDDGRACNCPALKASDSLVTSYSQLSIEHGMRELRLLWDPGTSTFLVTPLKNDNSNHSISNEHVGRLVSCMGYFSFHDKTDLWSQSEHQFIMLRGVFEEVMLDEPPAKPPDSKQLSAIKAIQGNCFSLEAIPSWQIGAFSLGNFAISALWHNATLAEDKIFVGQILAANSHNLLPCISTSETEHICIFVKWWPWSIFSAPHILDSSMKKGIFSSSGRIYPWNPRYAVLLLHYFMWEFSVDTVLRKTAVPNLTNLKYFWAQLLLQYYSCYTTLHAFLHVHYCCLPIVLDCSYSETVQQLVCYSRMFSSTEAILSEMCMSTVTSANIIVVFSSGKIAQEGKDATAKYRVLNIQLPMSKTSHIWDPGIKSLLLLYIWLHVHWSQLLDCTSTATHKCYFFVPASLPPTHISIHASSNTEIGELSPRCLIFHIHQITNGQWEFLHQQGVQKNYNAKNLLSSKNYLQIWEIDIIFITSLPP